MKIVNVKNIVAKGEFSNSNELKKIEKEISVAIKKIVWPEGNTGFFLNPNSKGKGRGQGNGVRPIKNACVKHLTNKGWETEIRLKSKTSKGIGPLDMVKETPFGKFGLEWETGNISSTHRALNKICLKVLDGELVGGILVLPSNELYPYLTDRIGNYREIEPYLRLWESLSYKNGYISIFVVEQDGMDDTVPRIPKGTDGRALL